MDAVRSSVRDLRLLARIQGGELHQQPCLALALRVWVQGFGV